MKERAILLAERAADPVALGRLSDEALLSCVALRQDRAAFGELFRRYSGRVRAFLIRGGCPVGLAEEATQDVMVTLWRKAASFDPAKAGAATWIYTIARNRRIDLIRRERRAEPRADDPLFQPDPVDSAETDMAGADRDAIVRAALSGLPEEQAAVVRLAFFDGLSHAEIAETLAVPLGTVKSRLRLAFVRLRDALGAGFADELVDT